MHGLTSQNLGLFFTQSMVVYIDPVFIFSSLDKNTIWMKRPNLF